MYEGIIFALIGGGSAILYSNPNQYPIFRAIFLASTLVFFLCAFAFNTTVTKVWANSTISISSTNTLTTYVESPSTMNDSAIYVILIAIIFIIVAAITEVLRKGSRAVTHVKSS